MRRTFSCDVMTSFGFEFVPCSLKQIEWPSAQTRETLLGMNSQRADGKTCDKSTNTTLDQRYSVTGCEPKAPGMVMKMSFFADLLKSSACISVFLHGFAIASASFSLSLWHREVQLHTHSRFFPQRQKKGLNLAAAFVCGEIVQRMVSLQGTNVCVSVSASTRSVVFFSCNPSSERDRGHFRCKQECGEFVPSQSINKWVFLSLVDLYMSVQVQQWTLNWILDLFQVVHT